MTTEMLYLDLTRAKEEAGARARLATRGCTSDRRGLVFLTPECNSAEEFEQAVEKIKEGMDALVQQAREAFEQQQPNEEVPELAAASVEEIWQVLEGCTAVEEMQRIFNTLDRQKRQEVADFVLTRLNIFKGAASTFSQHYNEEKFILE